MKNQPIVVILDSQEMVTPEQVEFKTVFLLTEQHDVLTDLTLMNERFLRFLAENNTGIVSRNK